MRISKHVRLIAFGTSALGLMACNTTVASTTPSNNVAKPSGFSVMMVPADEYFDDPRERAIYGSDMVRVTVFRR